MLKASKKVKPILDQIINFIVMEFDEVVYKKLQKLTSIMQSVLNKNVNPCPGVTLFVLVMGGFRQIHNSQVYSDCRGRVWYSL